MAWGPAVTARPAPPNVDGVETGATFRAFPLASCSGCDWSRSEVDASAWLAIRAAARRHVAATGHVVDAAVTTAYRYRRVGPVRRPGVHL